MAKYNERNLNVTIKNQDDNKDEVVISISSIMKNLKRFLVVWIAIAIIVGLLTFSLSGIVKKSAVREYPKSEIGRSQAAW